ncbi:MAG: hypothetical protein ACI9BW_004174 [Gammaproteobacteria bacterium]|jgi:uncharacterized protein YyaL (SSP411 family)
MFRKPIVTISIVVSVLATHALASDEINWHDWQPSAFEAARTHNKLIMVNVGHEGCTACRYMENNTFTDAAVIGTLNKHFISIQVDSEARPDIGERYSDWAWPATAFMRPDGTQVTALRGSRSPANFLPVLEDLVSRHAAGALSADRTEPYVAPRTQNTDPLIELRARVRAQLDRGFNDERGGWGDAHVLDYAEPTLQFLLRAHLFSDAQSLERGLKNARGFAQQFDEVWGGVFYASFKAWTNTVKEKRTESQAAALQIFSSAYQLTGEPLFRQRLRQISKYLNEHLRSPEGLFYASQKDQVDGLTLDIDAYYSLDDAGRRSHGLPNTDHSSFTDLNARIVEGLAQAFHATQEKHFLDTAITTARALRAERRTEAGWYLQLKPAVELQQDRRVHVLRFDERPYLRTQAYLGRALLTLYQASADRQWLEEAEQIAVAMRDHLEDKQLGGFYGAAADGTEAIIARRKPLEDNAVAAQFLYLLGVASKQEDLKLVAEKTIRAVAAPEIMRREGKVTGNLAMALEFISAGYVEFSVVGDAQDPTAQALLKAGQSVFEPRKVVHFESPGRYPDRGRSAMYICNDDACSLPIYDAEVVAVEAKKFTPVVFAGLGARAIIDTPLSTEN